MSQPTQPAASAGAFDLRETDLFAFCRKGSKAAGDVAMRELPRILAETAADAPASAVTGRCLCFLGLRFRLRHYLLPPRNDMTADSATPIA